VAAGCTPGTWQLGLGCFERANQFPPTEFWTLVTGRGSSECGSKPFHEGANSSLAKAFMAVRKLVKAGALWKANTRVQGLANSSSHRTVRSVLFSAAAWCLSSGGRQRGACLPYAPPPPARSHLNFPPPSNARGPEAWRHRGGPGGAPAPTAGKSGGAVGGWPRMRTPALTASGPTPPHGAAHSLH